MTHAELRERDLKMLCCWPWRWNAPWAKEHRQALDNGKSSPRMSGNCAALPTPWFEDFWPPELQENKLLSFSAAKGGPVVKTLHFYCRGHWLDPWLGNSGPTRHTAWPKKKKKLLYLWYYFTVATQNWHTPLPNNLHPPLIAYCLLYSIYANCYLNDY